jgi:hypothetical protein
MAFRTLLACTAALIAAVSVCSAAPDPLDSRVPVATPLHRSAFEGYRRFDDAKPLPWRQANDTVERIGGWRSYAREAADQAPAAASPSASASSPARSEPARPAAGHGGHKH